MPKPSYTHEFHPYPAKFPPAVARDLILRYSKKGETVLDPFCGSGTTLVEAVLESRDAIGIELNPIGALISIAKSQHYSAMDILQARKILASVSIEKLRSSSKMARTLPIFHNRDHWFKPEVAQELQTIKSVVVDNPAISKRLKPLFATAFSRIIVPVSFQDGETRYARVEKDLPSGRALELFLKTCGQYLQAIENSTRRTDGTRTVKVIVGDIHDKFPVLKARSVDLILTSPPYINSFDYYLYHKQRLHWLNEDPKAVRAREVGNHHRVDRKDYESAVAEYEKSLDFLVQHSARTLKKGRSLVVLIGDGIVKNRVVEANLLLHAAAKKHGMLHSSTNSYDLVSVSRMFIKEHARLARKKHHVVVLTNPA